MLRCEKCNKDLENNVKFCSECGGEVTTKEKKKESNKFDFKKIGKKKVIISILIILVIIFVSIYYRDNIYPKVQLNRIIKVLEEENFELDEVNRIGEYHKDNLVVYASSKDITLTVNFDDYFIVYSQLNFSSQGRRGGIRVGEYDENGYENILCYYSSEGEEIHLGKKVHSYEKTNYDFCEYYEYDINKYKEYYESIYEKAGVKFNWNIYYADYEKNSI